MHARAPIIYGISQLTFTPHLSLSLSLSLSLVGEQFNLMILNGCLPGDKEGNYTYIARNGSSVIDYFLLSVCLVHLGTRLAVIPNIES